MLSLINLQFNQTKKYNRVMLNGEGSEKGKKATIGLISSVDIKVKSKNKEDTALLLFFLSEITSNHTIYRQNARVLETRNFTLAYMKGWVWRGEGGHRDDFVRTKISWMNSTGVLVLERPYLGRVAGHL